MPLGKDSEGMLYRANRQFILVWIALGLLLGCERSPARIVRVGDVVVRVPVEAQIIERPERKSVLVENVNAPREDADRVLLSLVPVPEKYAKQQGIILDAYIDSFAREGFDILEYDIQELDGGVTKGVFLAHIPAKERFRATFVVFITRDVWKVEVVAAHPRTLGPTPFQNSILASMHIYERSQP